MPSTLLSTAFWIRVAWPAAAGSLEYFRSMLSLAAAASAPGPDLVPERVARGLVGDHRDGLARGVGDRAATAGCRSAARPAARPLAAAHRCCCRRSAQGSGHGDRGQPEGLLANRHRFGSFRCGTTCPREVGNGDGTGIGGGSGSAEYTESGVTSGASQREVNRSTRRNVWAGRARTAGSRRRRWRPFDASVRSRSCPLAKSGLRHM